MDGVSRTATSLTLLGKLRQNPTSQEAWTDFVRRYGPGIYDWCRRWNLSDADAQDVTQNVLLNLARKMRDFAYDPTRSFRAWLKTLTRHAWSDYLASRERPGRGTGDSRMVEQLQSVEAGDDLVTRLDREFDRELLDQATLRVQLRVEPHTWEAFRLLTVEGLTGTEAGARLGLRVATVFKAKSKVQKMLQEELHKLDQVES